jgi:hypothetical protein
MPNPNYVSVAPLVREDLIANPIFKATALTTQLLSALLLFRLLHPLFG